MTPMTRYQMWYGRNEPPPETRRVRAGAATALIQGTDVRYFCLGELEIVRRIYIGVRDPNWRTIPGTISNVEMREAGDLFDVSAGESGGHGKC